MAEARNARFQLTNCLITRVHTLEKVVFLTVLCQAGKYANYYDVTVFPGRDPQLGRWGEGEAVTINGEVQVRKPKEGGGKWETQLVARRIEAGDPKAAPTPRNGGGRRNDDEVGF